MRLASRAPRRARAPGRPEALQERDLPGRPLRGLVHAGRPALQIKCPDRHALACDLTLVLGSSLVRLAVESGAKVVFVNRGQTPCDGAVSLRLPVGIGELLPPAVELVKRELGA